MRDNEFSPAAIPFVSTMSNERYKEIVAFATDYRAILPWNKQAEIAMIELIEEVNALRIERQNIAAEINAVVSGYEAKIKQLKGE